MFGWFAKKTDLELEMWEQILRLWEVNKNLSSALANLTSACAQTKAEIEQLNYQMLKITDTQNQLVAHVTGTETPETLAPKVH